MRLDSDILDALASLLEYPREGYVQRVRDVAAQVRPEHARAAALLEAFASRIAPLSSQDLEELFTRTFDINPTCCLEVGWHIHGDNYDRGDFLVRMRQHLRNHKLEETSELPDHMVHVLPVLARLEGEQAAELKNRYVLPALAKMLDGLAAPRAGRDSSAPDNPYEYVLQAIRTVLTADEPVAVAQE